ncbi:hypothetical protein DERP_007684 [Dermatophagoides pteronyssinus]|uniref:Uncharacterized protein n=1 Tax=Dermatophagoides pteronyssinus TaxID=6956 RepID=A0ABQ8JL06_DERPT|nr:hypothetical protein DERP_007684 [Dermatophagoides pteronyssinus]
MFDICMIEFEKNKKSKLRSEQVHCGQLKSLTVFQQSRIPGFYIPQNYSKMLRNQESINQIDKMINFSMFQFDFGIEIIKMFGFYSEFNN